MTTALYPRVDSSTALNEEHKAAILELAWLLGDLSETMDSLRSGLDDCLALLDDDQTGSMLVLSSTRSEALKGYVQRVGQRIAKADIHIQLSSLNRGQSVALALADGHDYTLPQLADCASFLAVCRRVISEMDFVEPTLVLTQLRRLLSNIRYAHLAVRNTAAANTFPYPTLDADCFSPALPEMLSVDFCVSESGVIADVRSLTTVDPAAVVAEPALPARRPPVPFAFRGNALPREPPPAVAAAAAAAAAVATEPEGADLSRVQTSATSASALTASSTLTTASSASWLSGLVRRRGAEPVAVYEYKGRYVKTVERITVQSFDPGLITLMSKLTVLELNVGQALRKLEVAMNWK
ncbi:RAVE subunit 2/Rogdi [Dipodascopsis tothii]|uniref:RAVE subunit 2/Rogdi n=1 Tax=Dipodascopsis tothii TaxID=44089 RepID=UPI0034CFA374